MSFCSAIYLILFSVNATITNTEPKSFKPTQSTTPFSSLSLYAKIRRGFFIATVRRSSSSNSSPMERDNSSKFDRILEGFSPASAPRIQWKSRRRSASGRNLDQVTEDHDSANKTCDKQEEPHCNDKTQDPETVLPELSERRKALFEPLEPVKNINGRRPSAESLLPPPDFDATAYPRGWLIGKKRKLVNVDVVESMRRIAIQEMNRKDREIDGLNEQLDEDARCLEHLQIQLLQEKSKRSEVERENAMLHDQISMLMSMLENGADGSDEP